MLLAILRVRADPDATIHDGVGHVMQVLERKFPRSPIYVACEGQPQLAATAVFSAIENCGDNVHFFGSPVNQARYLNTPRNSGASRAAGMELRHGICIAGDRKDIIINNLSTHLLIDSLSFSPDLYGHTNMEERDMQIRGVRYETPWLYCKDLMQEELRNMEIDEFGAVSGKRNGMQDDLGLSLAWAVSGYDLHQSRKVGIFPRRFEPRDVARHGRPGETEYDRVDRVRRDNEGGMESFWVEAY